MAVEPIVALEIGTSEIRVLVGEPREDGHLMITGIGSCPSRGVRKGEVTSVETASTIVKNALHIAEEHGGVYIHSVHLLITGEHIKPLINSGNTHVASPDGTIGQKEIEHVINAAKAVSLHPENEILHTINQSFTVDEQEHIVNPAGLEGSRLCLNMLILHGVRTRINNVYRVVEDAGPEVEDIAFSGLCSALGVLSPEQKELGALVIDMGGGTTDYLVYADQSLAYAGCLAVGGEHITNDISQGLGLTLVQAERLKRQHGQAFLDTDLPDQRIALAPEGGMAGKEIRRFNLHTIIDARVDETLCILREVMEDNGLLYSLGAGVIITGGGVHLKGMPEAVQRVFGLPCTIGKPRNVSGLAAVTSGAEYAATVGMLRYACKARSQMEQGSFFKRTFSRLFKT